GSYAFDGCTSLTEATIGDGVTSIGSYAFNGCISLEEITIPDSVTSIGSYAFYECTSLAEATFEDPTAITSMGSSVFENCKMLGSVNTYTTLEDVLSLFENATIDTTVFANTALDRTKVSQLTVTDGNESFSVAIGGVSDVLTVSISSTQNSATMWSDAYETIPYLYTGQNATVEVSLSPQGVDLTGETLDFYVGFTGLNADMTLAVGTHNYTMSDGTEVEVTISYVGGWPDAYKISINGDNLTSGTLSFNFNTTYESPSSAGGSMYVWIEDNMDNALRVDWGTKVDEYELTKSNWNTVSFAAEDDDIYMLDLAYSFNLNRDTTASYLEVGKDYISSVDFTDILDLPEELEWRDGLIDAIKNGEWYTTLTYVDCDVYVTIGGEDYLFCSIDMPSTNVVTFQSCNMEITSDNKIALSYSYMNASATSEWTTSTAYLYFGDSVIKVTDPDAEPKSDSIDIVNNLTSTEHFHYSTEDQVDTATATKTIAWGTPEITLKKSGSNSYLGDSGTYTITAKNPSAFSYHELQYLYDVPSRYLYIKADDMQDMFDDDSDDHTLTIQMTNATLTAPNSKTVTNMSGNNSVTLDQQNVQAAGTDYSGLEKTDSSLITSSATITITWVDDNSDLLVMTVSDGGSETSYTIGSGGNYDSISDALSAIGYIVTYAVQYSMTWDLGDDYVLRGGTTLTKSYVLTAKDTFMLLTGDQYWYIKDNSTYTYGGNYNYIYAKDENNTQITYAYTPSTMRLYRDFVLDKDDTDVKRYSSDSSSYESVDDDTIEYGDIISYQTKVTHLGSASYDGLPLVDKMSGGQILLIPVSANATNTSLPTQSLETVTVDGTDYYILNQAGTYSNVVVDSTGRIADTVTVTVNGDGSVETMIYWYLSISGSQTLTFDYMSIVRPVNGDLDESYSYTLSNEAWLNDHETHRLYDAAFKDGAILKVSKDIVTSGADNNDPSDDELESRTTLSEGETVTYRFTLNATGPVTLTGSDIYDVLPETVSGNAWTASDITVRLVTDDDDVTPDTLSAWASGWYVTGENPDEATLGASDPDTQQYLRWNTGLSIAYEGMLYVYVTLTFPDGSDWLEYVEAYADLENTLHVLQLYDTVYHDMPIKSSVYLQKGVASIKELYSSSPRTSFSSGKYNGLYYYTIDGALSSWSLGSNLQYLNRSYYNESLVTYYTVLYNDGRTNLYLSDLYDVLPAGFRYVAYSYIYTSSSYTSLTKYLTSGLELYGSDEMAIEDVVYKTFDIESSYDETNNIVTFSLSGGNLSQNGDEYYLAPGEAIAFQYCAIPQYSADTEDVSTNTITMQFDDNGAGVDVANVHSVYKTSAEQNEGTCSVEGTSYIENLGLSGDSDIWLVSAVTVYRDSIVPNIVKSTDQVTATDTEDIDWSVTVTNSGNATMDGYTLIDVMQSPYSFSGTVSYTVKAKTNGGTGTSTTTYTLFTIKDATDTELTLNALVPGTRTNSEHKDFTLQLNGASSTIELYQSSGTIPITVRW
ncbi:MAG: leucine-rich repeat domain-containing protein, partial [Lachnospiraceae bacterium]|nr:leucine-rich repeat domain-containing protein [Lachnospiraceae bacterium]